MLLSRFFCIARASRPRRGTPRECSPLSKRRADCGVFYVPLSQRVFCERAERGTRLEKKSGTRKKTATTNPREAARRHSWVSRKMVNILIVDPHGSSVIGIKLCIIKSGRIGRIGSGGRGLSDELGYASGDGRHRITVDFASCYSRHGKIKPSESRSAVIRRPRICTHSCLNRARVGEYAERDQRWVRDGPNDEGRRKRRGPDDGRGGAGRRGWETYRVGLDERRRDSPR